MLRTVANRFAGALRSATGLTATRVSLIGAVRHSSHEESEEVFTHRYVTFFNRKEIDGWEVRKGMNDLLGMDLVPAPEVIIAGLHACRRVNDYALAVRWLEGCKDKCGDKVEEVYPYLLQEICPTLTELGVLTPEEMGYDTPELHLKTVYEL